MHSDDYTPTTEEVRADFGRSLLWPAAQSPDRTAAFDRWLAAHVAEKRAEWEAEQGEPEWEYACRDDRTGSVTSVGAPWMDHEYAERVTANEYPYMAGVRRRKAGPWLPVPDTTTEICGAELNADSQPCQSPRGHAGDHWTPSDEADKPMWWSATNHESEG